MKKYLMASTAIVATGMIAAAPAAQAAERIQAKVGGYMQQWFGYGDNKDFTNNTVIGTNALSSASNPGDLNGWNVLSDSEVFFEGATQLDNGVKVGFNIQLEGNQSGDQIDESYAFIEGRFGRILIGSENSAGYLMNFAPPDVGIGINSGDQTAWISYAPIGGGGYFRSPFGSTNIEVDGGDNDSQRISYFTPRMYGFQFGASYAPDVHNGGDDQGQGNKNTVIHNAWAVGVNYRNKFSGVDVGASGTYMRGSAPETASTSTTVGEQSDPSAWSAGLLIGYGGFEIGGSVAQQMTDIQGNESGRGIGYTVGAAYRTGPIGVSINWFHGERVGVRNVSGRDEQNTITGSVNYSLGPGVALVGTVGHVDYEGEGAAAGEADNSGFIGVVGLTLQF